MDQQKSSAGAIVLTVVVTALVVGGGIYWWQTSKTVTQQTQSETSTVAPQKNTFEQIAKFNCEQSGGTFSQSQCQCPKESRAADSFTYEESTGYCIDSFGIPGGEEGETAKKLQELQMLKNQ